MLAVAGVQSEPGYWGGGRGWLQLRSRGAERILQREESGHPATRHQGHRLSSPLRWAIRLFHTFLFSSGADCLWDSSLKPVFLIRRNLQFWASRIRIGNIFRTVPLLRSGQQTLARQKKYTKKCIPKELDPSIIKHKHLDFNGFVTS